MTTYRHALFGAVSILAITTTAQAQSRAPLIDFDIPAGPLGTALNAYADQADRQLMFTSEQVAGLRTAGVSGTLSADAALERLLANTGLVVSSSQPGVYVLQRHQGVVSAAQVEDIIVTGTLLRGPGATPSPVTVIRRDDLDRTGRATVAEALAALPQNYAGSATPAAALVGTDPMQSNSGLATGVNLRGLGADSTLVLVNGRRMAGAGGRGDFADVSGVPTAAVDRVDVLLDGASALYGSDAVGGVVNIILRRDFEGQESRLRMGAADGGAESIIAAHTIGRRWSTGQALVSYEYDHQNALSRTDRPYSATGDLRPFGGTDHRSIYAAPGNIVELSGGSYVSRFAIRPGADGQADSPGEFAAGEQNYGDTAIGGVLAPQQERHTVYLYGRQALGTAVELSGDLRLSRRDYQTQSLIPTTIATVTTANPFFYSPTGAASHQVAYSFTDDFGRTERTGEVESLGASLGALINLPAAWEAETFLTYGREKTRDGQVGMLQSTYFQEALGNTADNPATAYSAATDGYFNLFGTEGGNTAAVVDFVSSGYAVYEDESEVASANLIVQGPVAQLPGGTARLAIGAQFRTEALENSGETFVSGLTPTFSQSPRKAREVSAAFAEVRLPLFGPANARPGLQRLELSAAGRVEHYDDIGSTANPKVGLLWSPVQDLNLRTNWGTSFRAPAMTELAERRYISATYVSDGTERLVAVFEAGGNPDLKPEEAETLTVGFDYAPDDRPYRISATWFDIRFSDQIARPALDNLSQVLLDPALAPFVRRVDPNSPEDRAAVEALITSPDFLLPGVLPVEAYGVIVDGRWLNAAEVHVRGVDGSIAYDLDLGAAGALTLEATGSYMDQYQRKITPTAPQEDLVDTLGFPVDFRGTAAAVWRRDDVDVRVAVNRVSGYRDFAGARIAPWTTADVQFGWRPSGAWGQGVSLVASVRNLTDEDPPFYDGSNGAGFDAGQADPFGRQVSLQLTKRW